MFSKSIYIFISTFVLGFILTSCATTGSGLNLISTQEEEQLGVKYAKQVEHDYQLLHDSAVDTYLNDLGNKILTYSPIPPSFPFTFRAIKDEQINAFAIPGGYVYVNLGLLRKVENEAELVGVIGHEVGHVVHRHGTQRMTDAQLVDLGAAITESLVGPENGRTAGTVTYLLGQGKLLDYGREAELEADRTAVQILTSSNYDLHAMHSFFTKLEEEEKRAGRGGDNFLTDLLATHPKTSIRIEQVDKMTKGQSQAEPILTTPAFENLKNRVNRMPVERK